MNKRFFSLFIVFTAYFSCAWTFLPGGGYKIKTIVIDAGHGGKDPGNLGTGRYKVSEKHVALDVALKLGELIKAEFPEINVIYTRDKDVFIGLDERAKIANDANADLFISIHCNAAKNLGANGSETFVLGLHKTEENLLIAQQENSVIFMEDDYETKYEGFDPNSAESIIALTMMQSAFLNQSIELSAHVQDEFVKKTKREDRGVKQAGFLVLRKTTMPAILIELGFLTNKTDEDYLISANGKVLIASSIFSALKTYKSKHETVETGASVSEEKTPEQLKAETEKLLQENAALKAKQSEIKAKEEAALKTKKEAEAKAKTEAEAKAKQDVEAKAKADAAQKAKSEAEAKAKTEADRKAKAIAELKTMQEAEAKSEAELKAKEEADLKAKENAERIAKLKEIKEQDKNEQSAKMEADHKAKQEAEVKVMLEEEKKRLEKEQLLAEFNQRMKEKEELEALKKQQEDALNKIKTVTDKNAELEEKVKEKFEEQVLGESDKKEEDAIKAKQDEEAKKNAELKAKQEVEAKAKADQKLKEEAAAKAKLEAETKAKEQADIKAKQEAEAKAKLEAEKKDKEQEDLKAELDAEAKAKAEVEQKLKEEVALAKAKLEAEKKAKAQADLKTKQDAEAKAKSETEQKLKEDAEQQIAKTGGENEKPTNELIVLEEKTRQASIAQKKKEEVAELEREVMLAKKEELLRKIRETLESPVVQPEVKTEPKKEEPKKTEVKVQAETQNAKTETKPKETAATGKLVFRVQFFSSPTAFPLSSPKFSGVENVLEYLSGGLHKYASGNFDSIEAATAHQAKVRKAGFGDAFVVAFLDGERIDMAKAREILNK